MGARDRWGGRDEAQGAATDRTRNTISGDVSGTALQSEQIRDVHIHHHDRPVADWPIRIGVVPRRADQFQHRGGQLAGATPTEDDVRCSSQERPATYVLSGLGGVGKTQLAADHAERAWVAGELDLLVWVAAGSRESVVSTYASAAAELGWYTGEDAEHGAERFLARLASESLRWLVVLDDVRSPGGLRGLWPPHANRGRTVATTRRRDAALLGAGRRFVPVDVFTPEESRAYLTASLAAAPHLASGADELAADLGHLPLALAQAAVYLLDEDIDCHYYRSLLADRRRQLADLVPEPDALPEQHRETLAATWSLSVDLAGTLRPRGLAPRLLEIAALLDPDGIPHAVFTSKVLHSRLCTLLELDLDDDSIRAGLRGLHRLNLATVDLGDPQRSVRTHALVQRATRDQLARTELSERAGATAEALLEIWPKLDQSSGLPQVLRANTEALHRTAGTYVWHHNAQAVLFRAASSLGRSGLLSAASTMFEQLRVSAEQHFGADDLRTLLARSHLADWHGQAGDAQGAVTMLRALVDDRLRVSGPEHPYTLFTRSNLALWRHKAGDPSGSATEYTAVLDELDRLLGPAHPGTLSARNNLALARGEAGDARGAVTTLEDLLTDSLRVLGPDHPRTLTVRNNLAHWLGESGEASAAANAFTELHHDRHRLLGAEHPETLSVRNNLARWQDEAGDPNGALTKLDELIPDMCRLLGAEHPRTLVSRNNHATAHGHTGNAAAAVAELDQLLADQLRILGPDHPDTRVTRHNLAQWRTATSAEGSAHGAD